MLARIIRRGTGNWAGLADIVGQDHYSTGESTLKLHSHDESYHRDARGFFSFFWCQSAISLFKQIVR